VTAYTTPVKGASLGFGHGGDDEDDESDCDGPPPAPDGVGVGPAENGACGHQQEQEESGSDNRPDRHPIAGVGRSVHRTGLKGSVGSGCVSELFF
jgi:hypothetical protein